MGNTRHVKTFNQEAYRTTVATMRARGEDVHAKGRAYREETGGLHPNVDIVGKPPRSSNNAMMPGDKPGIYILRNGISLPVLSLFDGTGSTSVWVKDFFLAAERQYKRLDGVRTRYNPQLASGVVNDVYNVRMHSLPVVQISQFEGDELSAEQVRLLQPASMGNDSTTEDYDLGLYYGQLVYADLWTFYGLKGYMTLTLDDIGRGHVTAEGVRKYLGQAVDMAQMETSEICQRLLEHWHFFLLQVPTNSGSFANYTKGWWSERVAPGRILQVQEPRLLADVRAALVYAMEATNPTMQGMTEFLRSDDPQLMIDAGSLQQVWRIIQPAGELFSSQANLPGFQEIPRPGDIFSHYRHAWPIGHPREGENITPVVEK